MRATHVLTFRQGEKLIESVSGYYRDLARNRQTATETDFLGGECVDTGYRFGDVVILFSLIRSETQPGIDMASFGPTSQRIGEVESEILRRAGYDNWGAVD